MMSCSRRTPAWLGPAVVAAALLAFPACGPRSGRDEEAARGVAHIVEKVDSLVRNDEAVWPPDLAQDVPAFTGGTILRVDEGLTANGTSWTIRLADIEEGAGEAYLGELEGAGWETTAVRTASGGRFTARRESFELTLSIDGKRGTLIVQLVSF